MNYPEWDHNRDLAQIERHVERNRTRPKYSVERDTDADHDAVDELEQQYERKLLTVFVGIAIIVTVALIVLLGSAAWFLIQLALPK